MKEIIVFGSTGSIGTQTLNIVRRNMDKFKVVGMSCHSNIELLARQVEEFCPKYVAISDEKAGKKFSLEHPDISVIYGEHAPEELAKIDEGELIVAGQVGISGLLPTIEAIKKGKNIALANKETMVTGGDYVVPLAREYGVNIYPVDSEHSAIWQSSHFNSADKAIKKLILTASGGSFRDYTMEQLENVTLEQALKHPTWTMGAKVTIDSATMMNKGLEVIEAKQLFGVGIDDIDVVIHKESIVHSMVEYVDNTVIAELSYPSMELPIQLALTYPDRIESAEKSLDFAKIGSLTFEKPDLKKYKCLDLAIKAGREGGLHTVVLNGANEVLVEMFIKGLIKYLDIPYYIEKTLGEFKVDGVVCPESIIDCDKRVREYVKRSVKG